MCVATGQCFFFQWGLAVSTLCVFQLHYHMHCFVSLGFDTTCSCRGASMDGLLSAQASCCAGGIRQQPAFCTICWQDLARRFVLQLAADINPEWSLSELAFAKKHARQNGGCVEPLLATLLARCSLACALRCLSAHWRDHRHKCLPAAEKLCFTSFMSQWHSCQLSSGRFPVIRTARNLEGLHNFNKQIPYMLIAVVCLCR